MKVELIRYTPEPEELCGEMAALCYDGKDPERSLKRAMNGGHLSVSEHASFTFRVEGASRVLLAQITRHRIASFSVQSQPYSDVKPEFVIPPSIIDAGYEREYSMICNAAYELFCEMCAAKIPAEDARFIIPQGVECKFGVTMNVRELLHFFELRCCRRAQWEIRELAWAMYRECKKAAPELFKYAGPSCLHGWCSEGKMSCGNPYTEEEAFEET
jgi:thymidylate synthase (FAD)